jgi:hypothetical protein
VRQVCQHRAESRSEYRICCQCSSYKHSPLTVSEVEEIIEDTPSAPQAPPPPPRPTASNRVVDDDSDLTIAGYIAGGGLPGFAAAEVGTGGDTLPG